MTYKLKRLIKRPRIILTRAVVIFVLFMFTVYAVGLWHNMRTLNIVRRQIVDYANLQLTYLADRLDREIEHVFRQQVALNNDFGFRLLMLHPDLSDMGGIFTQLRRINNNISTIYNSSPHISDVGVYLPNLDRVSRWGILFASPTDSCRALFNNIQASDTTIFPDSHDLIMGIPVFGNPAIPYRRGEGEAITFVRFSGDAIAQTMNQMALAYDLTIALLHNGEYVFTVGPTSPSDWHQVLAINNTKPYLMQNGNDSFWVLRTQFAQHDFELAALLSSTHVDIMILPSMVGTVIIYLASMIVGTIIFTIYISRLIKQIYEERRTAETAQLGQLNLQITPHFLYNCFYQIYRLGKLGDVDAVSEMSLKLSQYYQYITRTKDDAVTLQIEVKHAEDYAAIQSIRNGGRIECRFNPVPDECRSLKVPKLFLQPLVENAYLHGMSGAKDMSLIDIGFELNKGELCIWVEDDGIGLNDAIISDLRKRLENPNASNETTSLLNIYQRFRFIYGKDAQMNISRGETGGLRIDITIVMERG